MANRFTIRHACVVLYVSAAVVSGLNPVDRLIWTLEIATAAAGVILLGVASKRTEFSVVSYVSIMILLLIHLIPAHFTFLRSPLGVWLSPVLGDARNGTDRLLHFLFGACTYLPTREWLQGRSVSTSGLTDVCALSIPLSLSAIYELSELVLSWVLSATAGGLFVARQGDTWDTEKDLVACMLGLVLASFIRVTAHWIKKGDRKVSTRMRQERIPQLGCRSRWVVPPPWQFLSRNGLTFPANPRRAVETIVGTTSNLPPGQAAISTGSGMLSQSSSGSAGNLGRFRTSRAGCCS